MSATLESLTAGERIVFGGDQVTVVSAELAAAFVAGDRLVVVHETGTSGCCAGVPGCCLSGP